ncbi:MAG: amidohydrolase family protein [Deinococcota bacterium]
MLVITGGTRFNSQAARFEANGNIVLDGEKIVAVDVNPAEYLQTERLEATGKTILPGLMNLHGHLAWDGFSDLESQTRFDGPMRYLKAARGLRDAAQAGVTTFRDMACIHDAALYAKQAVLDGLLPGPTVYTCGRAVCRTGGHIWWGNREADGVSEIRQAVREQVKDGADWIKLMAHSYSREEIKAAIDQAHDEGMRITTDAGKWANIAVQEGIDCIEHGGMYDDDTVAQIVARGVWIVPTLSPVVLQARQGHLWGMKDSVTERRKRQLTDSGRHEGLIKLREAGAKFAFGTDSGSPVVPNGAMLPEMQALLEFGVFATTEEVLQTATLHSAACLQIDDVTGSLETGKQADVLVVDGDVAKDLSTITQVEDVFVKGRHTVQQGQALLPDPRDYQTFANIGA